MGRILIYGATGTTGALVARRAHERGLDAVLAARDGRRLAAAAPPGARTRVVSLEERAALDRALADVDLVLHCAGPFSRTSRPMADACLRRGAHYLDLTGEVDVLEALSRRDGEARAAGVVLLPGAGFDVVPSDCLAAYVAARVPDARELEIAISFSGRPSRGTLRTAIESLGEPMRARRGGRIVALPRPPELVVDFGQGPRTCVLVTWGDISTAWATTGIPDVSVYFEAPPGLRRALRASRLLGPLLRTRALRAALDAWARRRARATDDSLRARGGAVLYARASGPRGSAAARLTTPEAYLLTAEAALAAAARVLGGGVPPGFQTPARAFGPDFVLSLPGCRREDLSV